MMSYVGNHTIDFKLFDVNSSQSSDGFASLKLFIIDEEVDSLP